MYPILTTYTINKAVNEKKLTATKIGKTRYYKTFNKICKLREYNYKQNS